MQNESKARNDKRFDWWEEFKGHLRISSYGPRLSFDLIYPFIWENYFTRFLSPLGDHNGVKLPKDMSTAFRTFCCRNLP